MRIAAPFVRSAVLLPAMLAAIALAVLPVAAFTPRPYNEAAVRTIQDAVDQLREDAAKQTQPLPEGQTRILSAVVMLAEGRTQWRPDVKATWKNAAVNDVLKPGAMIRTGRKSKLALRVGHNASVLVDRNTRVTLPQIVHSGSTLKTAVQVTRGRADFKVDRVGLTNDFSVVTPSTTLAVRGTGFGVDFGGLSGTQITAARTNTINSIEVTYLLTQATYQLSGGSQTSDANPDPANNQFSQSTGPASNEADDAGDGGASPTSPPNPAGDGRAVDTSMQSSMNTEEEIEEIIEMMMMMPEPEPFEFFQVDGTTFASTAAFICDVNIIENVFSTYESNLFDEFSKSSDGPEFSFPGLDELFADVDGIICLGIPTDETLMDIVDRVQAFCEAHVPEDIDLCVDLFEDAVIDEYQAGIPQ